MSVSRARDPRDGRALAPADFDARGRDVRARVRLRPAGGAAPRPHPGRHQVRDRPPPRRHALLHRRDPHARLVALLVRRRLRGALRQAARSRAASTRSTSAARWPSRATRGDGPPPEADRRRARRGGAPLHPGLRAHHRPAVRARTPTSRSRASAATSSSEPGPTVASALRCASADLRRRAAPVDGRRRRRRCRGRRRRRSSAAAPTLRAFARAGGRAGPRARASPWRVRRGAPASADAVAAPRRRRRRHGQRRGPRRRRPLRHWAIPVRAASSPLDAARHPAPGVSSRPSAETSARRRVVRRGAASGCRGTATVAAPVSPALMAATRPASRSARTRPRHVVGIRRGLVDADARRPGRAERAA